MESINQHLRNYFIGKKIKIVIGGREIVGKCVNINLTNESAKSINLIDVKIDKKQFSVSKDFKIEIIE